MMKNCALLAMSILLLACPQGVGAETEIESIHGQLLAITRMSVLDQSTAETTNQYMHYFADEPTLLPANGKAIVGRDAIADFYNEAFADIRILSNKYEDPVIVVDGAMATRRYLGTAIFVLADNEAPITAKNRYLDVLVKENGEWKMLWHSWVPVSWE